MRKLNCRAGDLAIIVDAFTSENIGMFVKVLGKHRNQSACPADDVIWLVQAPHPMRYEKLGKITHKRKGPVLDSWLNPIRGYPLGKDIAIGVVEALDIKEGRLQVFEVNQNGTISADMPEPRTNAVAFRIGQYRTVDEMIAAVDACSPLLFAVEQALRSYKPFADANTPTTLGTEENEDWCDWIADNKTNFGWMALFIDGWLEADADSSDSEFFQSTSAEVLAMQYLRRLGEDTLEKLGVYFVEGEYPGSSFNEVVLREDVDYTNQVARHKGLRFRFQCVG